MKSFHVFTKDHAAIFSSYALGHFGDAEFGSEVLWLTDDEFQAVVKRVRFLPRGIRAYHLSHDRPEQLKSFRAQYSAGRSYAWTERVHDKVEHIASIITAHALAHDPEAMYPQEVPPTRTK